MDSAPARAAEVQTHEERFSELAGLSIDRLWLDSGAESIGLSKSELACALLEVGAKFNFGHPPDVHATTAQAAAFLQSLQIQDLALAQACALGRDTAWAQFIVRFRAPMTRAAIAIAGSTTDGEELANSLYSEMFGLKERGGRRQSPLSSYSGRGSLNGFLRAALAQRNVDRVRRARRETELPAVDPPAPYVPPAPRRELVSRIEQAVTASLTLLDDEERFMISAWFLDRRTLLEISGVLRVHEATVSRKIRRLTERVQKEVIHQLQITGMSKEAAEEALGIEPGDLNLNLRAALQNSGCRAFQEQESSGTRRSESQHKVRT